MTRLHNYILAHEALMCNKSTSVFCPICHQKAEQGQMREIFWCNHCEKAVEDAIKAVYPGDYWDDAYGNHTVAVAFIGDKAIGELCPIRRTGGGGCNVRISFLPPFGGDEATKEKIQSAEWEFLPWWIDYHNSKEQK